MKATISSRRFMSYKRAHSFARMVKGTVQDLRQCKGALSNFKVTYNRAVAKKAFREAMIHEAHPNSYWE